MSDLKVSLDGMTVYLFRYEGQLVVDIDTADLSGPDVIGPHDVPNVRVRVNEALISNGLRGEALDE
jgi:hypothetical protein